MNGTTATYTIRSDNSSSATSSRTIAERAAATAIRRSDPASTPRTRRYFAAGVGASVDAVNRAAAMNSAMAECMDTLLTAFRIVDAVARLDGDGGRRSCR